MMEADEIVIKKEKQDNGEYNFDSGETLDFDKLSYEEKVRFVTPIAQPLAPKKLCKKILKLVKKAKSHTTKQDGGLRFGLKNVQKKIRGGEKGMVFIAGDVTPMDVIMHIPIFCEDNNIPYCYVPTRSDLGMAMGIASRGVIVVLVNRIESYQELYDSIWEKLKLLPMPI